MVTETITPTTAIPELTNRRGLIAMRVLYFLYFGALGSYWTFLNVYYKNIGLSGTEIGLVNTFSPLVSIFAATMWGIINDRLGRPRAVLRIAIPGVLVACLGISFSHTFTLIVISSSLMSFFLAAAIPLMDNTTLRLLGDQRSHYGRYRVTGSLGFILTTLTTGFLYEITGLHWLFYVYIAIMTLYLVATSFLPNEPVRLAGSVWGGLNKMMRQPAWLVFAISSLLLWIANNGTMNFMGITVQEMGGSNRLIGLVWMATAVAEIPIMLTSAWLLERYGATRLILTALILFTLRNALLAVMPNPNWAVFISGLGGLSFSIFWVASVNYANSAAPDHLKSTAQGLLFSIMNLAGVTGSLSAGWLYDTLGFRGLFWVTTVFAGAALLLFVIGHLTLRRRALK